MKPSGRPGTRSNAPKDDVPVEETELDDRYLLRDAICIEYLNPGIYEEKHVLKFKYSVRHVRRIMMAAELPEGLKDNTKERTLFRAVCDKLHIPYHGAYTLFELRQCLYDVRSSKQLGIGAASDKYGIGQTALWQNLKKVPKDHCRSDAELRLFIDNLQLKSPGRQHFFTDDEVALMLTTACAAKRAGEGQSDRVM